MTACLLHKYPAYRPFPFKFADSEYMAGFLSNYSDAELGDTVAATARRIRAKSGSLAYGTLTARHIACSWHDAALKEMGRRVAVAISAG